VEMLSKPEVVCVVALPELLTAKIWEVTLCRRAEGQFRARCLGGCPKKVLTEGCDRCRWLAEGSTSAFWNRVGKYDFI
jgi:hypothetical protein